MRFFPHVQLCSAAAIVLTFGLGSSAMAHAHLTSEVPAANATLTAAPSDLRLKFSEALEVKFTTLRVIGPDRVPVATGKPMLDPKDATLLIVPLSGTLPAGRYTVEWHAVSEDTHKTQGTYTFTVKP